MIASSPLAVPVDIVEFKPVALQKIDTLLAGAFKTVLGNAMGFTKVGPSCNPSRSNELILSILPYVDPITIPSSSGS